MAADAGAEGRDGISTKILKQFKTTLASPFRHIVNQSIRTGEYPAGWKLGLISPLPKSGDLTNPRNWRPVVINPAPSKLLESVLNQQIQEHCENEKVFSPSQHAYRRKRSCESALMDLDTLIQKGRNEHKTVGLVMTDMSAAFNLIKKDILIPLLRLYGFQVKALELVESYLTDRQTRCRIKKEISEPVTLDSGVGEGSVLGPVFFIIGMCAVGIVAKKTKELMAEKGHWVESWMLEFADDTSGMLICDNEEIFH